MPAILIAGVKHSSSQGFFPLIFSIQDRPILKNISSIFEICQPNIYHTKMD